MKYFIRLMLWMVFVYPCLVCSAEKWISVDLNDVTLSDALHMFSKIVKKNLIVSPAIHGNVSLHFHQMIASDAYHAMLLSNNLHEWRMDQAWYVGTEEEFGRYKEAEVRQTTLTDESSPLVTHFWQMHYAKATDIARLLQEANMTWMTKRGSVSVDGRTNILCVHDIAKQIPTIDKLVTRLDIPVRQVLIQATIASIDSDYEKELGINFATTSSDAVAPIQKGFNVAVIHLPDSSYLNIRLLALEKSGHGELISSPSLFVASQETAAIESGEEIPYQESSSSGATSVTFKKAVLSLKVTPHIMSHEQVLLELQVNQDKPSKRMVLGVPAINTRQVSTHVRVQSGQTIVLGGIYEMTKEQNQEGVPYLKNIPWVGSWFKASDISHTKRELLIFVTPTVMS